MNNRTNNKIILAVTGSIAAYKALDLARRLMDEGFDVIALLSEAAQEFVTPLSFQTLTGNPVLTDLFSLTEEEQIGHISAAQRANLILIAPATANSIAKAALGLADDYLGTILLATKAPLMIVPAMNPVMWESHKTQGHLETLRGDGAIILQPDSGLMACGDEGEGRFPGIPTIVNAVKAELMPEEKRPLGFQIPGKTPDKTPDQTTQESTGFWVGKKVLVTAGPTRERIDAVRYITNDSSGKMGYAIAEALQEAGAEVTLVTGPVSLAPPASMKVIQAISAIEMYSEVMQFRSEQAVIIGCAAVADVRPEEESRQKIKKGQLSDLKLVFNPDIIAACGSLKEDGQLVIGFAAESQNLVENAQSKLEGKNLDLVVANDISQAGIGFHSEENQVVIITKTETINLPKAPKKEIAGQILKAIEAL